MDTFATKVIIIFGIISCCCVLAKENEDNMEDYYKNKRKFERSGILDNCEQEISSGFIEVDPRPKNLGDGYRELEFGKIYKEETISIHKYEYGIDTTKYTSCEGEDEWRISEGTFVKYDKKGSLKVSSTGTRNNRKLVYSNTNWFENENLVKVKLNGVVWEITQGETPCNIEISKPRCRLGYEYYLYDNLGDFPGILPGETPCDIEAIEPNAKSAVLLLNPEQPIALEQKLIIYPYDIIKYYWYPHCKTYSEKFIDTSENGFFWKRYSRLLSPYWNKTEADRRTRHAFQ